MNKKIVLIGAGVGLFVIYAVKKYGSLANMLKGTPLVAGPANIVSGPNGPRADNASQPWYNNAVNFLTTTVGGSAAVQQAQKSATASALSEGGSIVHSLTDFAGISSWFGSSSTTSSVDDTSVTPAADLARQGTIMDVTLPASDVDQSNMIGAQMSAQNDPAMSEFPAITTFDDTTSIDTGGIGDSNSDFSYS